MHDHLADLAVYLVISLSILVLVLRRPSFRGFLAPFLFFFFARSLLSLVRVLALPAHSPWVDIVGYAVFAAALATAVTLLRFLGSLMHSPSPKDLLEANRRLRTEIQAREEAEAVKKAFISRVSHELRTPLTSVRGSLALVNGGLAEPREKIELLKIAERNSIRIIELVDEILDLEKVAAGKAVLRPEACRIAEACSQAREAIEGMTREKGVTIDISPTEATALADRKRLVQVLINLLSNAVKYTARGGSVEVKCLETGGKVEVRVTDHGPGIAPGERRRIFEPFYQVEGYRAKEGVGLGLAICKAVVEQLGGCIGVDEGPGGGSMFWVRLPGGGGTDSLRPPIPLAGRAG